MFKMELIIRASLENMGMANICFIVRLGSYIDRPDLNSAASVVWNLKIESNS